MKYILYTTPKPPGLLRKIAVIIAAVVVTGLVLMFSAVLLAIVLVVGAGAWAYLWWKTRELRKQMQNFPPGSMTMEREAYEGQVIEGEVIEGEVIRVDEPEKGAKR